MKKKELIAYAMDFASYVEERVDNIRSIIAFGSVARGKFSSDSDVDVFVDISGTSKKTEKEIKKIRESFEKTEKFNRWKLKGVSNDINVIVGDLSSDEWESLRGSIISDGITLFGKYESVPDDMKGYNILSYDAIENEKRRINLHRKLFGYKLKEKRYHGAVNEKGGFKIGPRAFMVSLSGTAGIMEILEDMNIKFRIFEVWTRQFGKEDNKKHTDGLHNPKLIKRYAHRENLK